MKQNSVLIPGSFDPITIGHQHLIQEALKLFPRVIIGVGVNSMKKNLFPLEKRLEWIRQTILSLNTSSEVEVLSYEGLTVDFCRQKHITHILRGLRNGNDLIYEQDIENLNRELDPDITTIYLSTLPGQGHVSSSAVREFLRYGHDVNAFLPQAIRNDFEQWIENNLK